MDYLCGKRMKSGDPVLFAWTNRGIWCIHAMPDHGQNRVRPDWGVGSLEDDREVTAIAIAGFAGVDAAELPDLLPALKKTAELLPHSVWILSRGEVDEQIAASRIVLRRLAQTKSRKGKGGAK